MSQPLPGLERQVYLTARQQLALAFVRDHGPVQSDELGAVLHADRQARGKRGHPADERCDWCQSEGKAMGDALKRHGLVKRIRGQGWVDANAKPDYGDSAIQGEGEIPW